jgi:hypothetical protein
MHPNDLDAGAAAAGSARAKYMLENAADMNAVQEGSMLKVTVTNNTGHKLPTGYPEGRRIWINVEFYDDANSVIGESGAYDPCTGVLTKDAGVKIYEVKPGLSALTAGLLGEPEGPSFHFVLNDRVYKDNRIPPRGFANAAFAEFGGSPVEYSYADGQYWDDTYYSVPVGAVRAEVTLSYQSTDKEFMDFLLEKNKTDSSGQTMYDIWVNNDRCPPVEMASMELGLSPVGPACDLDGSGTVDFMDVAVFGPFWGNDCSLEACGNANLDDSDQEINAADLAVIAADWLWGV